MPVETDSIHDRVRAALDRLDQRYTPARRHVVGLLAAAARPVTLPELLAMDPDLPQSSAYRNLDVLGRAGVVHRITLGSNRTRFELSERLVGHHHHLVCDDCGAVADFRLDEGCERFIDEILERAGAAAGFAAHHHELDLHGRCAACSESSADD